MNQSLTSAIPPSLKVSDDFLADAGQAFSKIDQLRLKDLREEITPSIISHELERAIFNDEVVNHMKIRLWSSHTGCDNGFTGNSPAAKQFLKAIEQNWWAQRAKIVTHDHSHVKYLKIKFTKDFVNKIADLHAGKTADFSTPNQSFLSRAISRLGGLFRRADSPAISVLQDKASGQTLHDHLTSSLKSVTQSVTVMGIDAEPLRLAVQKAMNILEKDAEGKARGLYTLPRHEMAVLAQEYARRADIVELGKPMIPEETKSVAASLKALSATFETANSNALTALSNRALIGMEVAQAGIEMRIPVPIPRDPA